MKTAVLLILGVGLLAVCCGLPPRAAHADEPAEAEDPALEFRSHAAADDYLYTQALMCFVERCGGQIEGNPTQGAEAAWNELRAEGYYAEELLDVACESDYGCGEPFGPTLRAGVTGTGGRPLAIPYAPDGEALDQPPPPPPEPDPPPEYTEHDPTRFFRPTVQLGLGLDGWILPHQGHSGRAFAGRMAAGWLFDIFMARAVLTGALGDDEDDFGFSTASVSGQAGPMFREDQGRLYIAGVIGRGWADFDGTPLRSDFGGLEFGGLLAFRNVGLIGAYAGFEVHVQRADGRPEWDDSSYIVHEPTPGMKFYFGIQLGL